MNLTQAQITEILDETANGKNGYSSIIKIIFGERNEVNKEQLDISNGYRLVRT